MIKVVDESCKERFEANCTRWINEGYKLSSSSCAWSENYGCVSLVAIFVKEAQK